MERYSKPIVVAGFPGVGKTRLMTQRSDVVDFDTTLFRQACSSSSYTWAENYARQVKQMINENKYHYILVSTHPEVRRALSLHGMIYIVVAPLPECKDEYLARYLGRGDSAEFIAGIDHNWTNWLTALDDTEVVIHLNAGQTLSDIIHPNGDTHES